MLFNLGIDLSPSATTAVAVEKDNCARLGARGGGDSGPSFAAFANNTRRERGVHLTRPLHRLCWFSADSLPLYLILPRITKAILAEILPVTLVVGTFSFVSGLF